MRREWRARWRLAIKDFVALNAWQIGKIEAGLLAADLGDFASDEELARIKRKFARPIMKGRWTNPVP